MSAPDIFKAVSLVLHYLLAVIALSAGSVFLGTFIYQWFLEWRRHHPRHSGVESLNCMTFMDE
jgi:hypothetical protein